MRTIFIGAQESPNGINSYTYNLAQELNNRGYASKVISFGSCDKVEKFQDVTVMQYKTIGGTMTSLPILYWRSLPYLIKHRRDIDMVMYQSVEFSLLPSFLVRVFGMKTCGIIHSLAEDSPKHGRLMKILLIGFMKFSIALTKNPITVSHTKAQEILRRYKKRCDVVPCGVFLPENINKPVDFLEEYSIIPGRYFLSIGRIDPIKNLEVLIDAFKRHDSGGYQLIIGGDVNNPYGQTIIERAKGCRDIIFPGLVYGDFKDELLANCAAYCLVSSSEGLPIALLEGLSYAKPVIVSRIPSIKEVLSESNIGLWSDVKNVEQVVVNMLKVESESADIKREGEIAYQIVKNKYTWQQVCDIYLELIRVF